MCSSWRFAGLRFLRIRAIGIIIRPMIAACPMSGTPGYGVRATGYGLRATGYGLRATGRRRRGGYRVEVSPLPATRETGGRRCDVRWDVCDRRRQTPDRPRAERCVYKGRSRVARRKLNSRAIIICSSRTHFLANFPKSTAQLLSCVRRTPQYKQQGAQPRHQPPRRHTHMCRSRARPGALVVSPTRH
jgi:hypothetical protein